MGKTPVCQQVFCLTGPGGCHKIYIWNTLHKGAPEQGFTAQLFASKNFPDAGAQCNMSEGIHILYPEEWTDVSYTIPGYRPSLICILIYGTFVFKYSP